MYVVIVKFTIESLTCRSSAMGFRAVRYILEDIVEIKLAIEAMIVIRYFDMDVKAENWGGIDPWVSAVSSS